MTDIANTENSPVMVSVICTAYNHEKYIRQCLDGFVIQETSFRFEVIVHDDASTDHTADIIREYEKKYPDIIKPIYQIENQYSKGTRITQNIIFPKCRGKYIAICEGDDYWCDPQKLQKQVNLLENHTECNFCVTRVRTVQEDGSDRGELRPDYSLRSGVISSEDFIRMVCTKYSFQTSSYCFRRTSMAALYAQASALRDACPVGDQVYLLFFGQEAPVYYLNEITSCYRVGAIGSWGSRFWRFRDRVVKHHTRMIGFYEQFDEYTKHTYHHSVKRGIFLSKYFLAESARDYRKLISYDFSALLAQTPRRIMKIIALGYLSWIKPIRNKLV